jgi:hypothetical protein
VQPGQLCTSPFVAADQSGVGAMGIAHSKDWEDDEPALLASFQTLVPMKYRTPSTT